MALQAVETTTPVYQSRHLNEKNVEIISNEKDDADHAAPDDIAQQCDSSNLTPHLERLVHLRQSHEITLLCAGETTRLMAVVLYLLSKPRTKSTHSFNIPVLRKLGGLSTGLASRVSPNIQALVIMLDEWQILWRLWGSLDVWFSIKALWKQLYQRVNLEERIDLALEAGQILSMACYYVFEGIAWLGYSRIISSPSEQQAKLYRWSSWGWCGGMLFDNARGIAEWRQKERCGQADTEWKANLRKVVLRNMAWAFVAANLGVENGFLPDYLSAILGAYASLSEIKDLWRAT